MSLVNDALKRATQAQKNLPPVPVVHLPLRPVDPAKEHKKGLGLVLPVTLITIIVAALFSLRMAKPVDRVNPPSPQPTTVPKHAALSELAPGPLIVSAKEVPATPPPAPIAMTTPIPPAPLRLQAVFYSPPNPSAIISGKTVHVGDRVRDLQVVAIGSSSALLVNGTRTNFLTLE